MYVDIFFIVFLHRLRGYSIIHLIYACGTVTENVYTKGRIYTSWAGARPE